MPRTYLQVMLAITVLIAVSYFLTSGSMPDAKVSARQKSLAKTYLENTRSSSYNEEGELTDVLEAEKATFYPARGESLLESPRLYSHNLNDDTWSASSNSGRYAHRREILTLYDDVILTNDTHQVHLRTQGMKIDLRKNTAISRVPVTVTHGQSSTRADGMVADLDAQTVKLLPNVESVYVPQNPGAEVL